MVIDIRHKQDQKVTSIKILGNIGGTGRATHVTPEVHGVNRISVCGHLDSDGVNRGHSVSVHLEGKREAENLIAALEMAIKLGWVGE